MNMFRSLLGASRGVKKLVGTDKLGNKYFEVVSGLYQYIRRSHFCSVADHCHQEDVAKTNRLLM